MRNNSNEGAIAKWQDYKFGMFIHWGLYSILARGEWALYHGQMDIDEYAKLADDFTAEHFDPTTWADTAKAAGMKYMVLTSRHHDGFCLFDSPASMGNHTSMTAPCRRDIVKDYTTACRNAGLAVGIYYSPMDWRFPGFHGPRMFRKSALEMKEQCHDQVKELMSNYGKIDILWYDGGDDHWLGHARDFKYFDNTKYTKENPLWPGFWENDHLDRWVRDHQPDILINERIGTGDRADFTIAEGKVGECNFERPWESCFTLAGAWGYTKGAKPRPLRECIHKLVQIVVAGGNLLLNVGPRPDGRIEDDQIERLKEIGSWLKSYGESIYGTRGGPIPSEKWGGTTHRDNILYVHILDWFDNTVRIPRPDATVVSCVSLTGADVTMVEEPESIAFSVSAEDRLAMDTIVKLELDRDVNKAYSSHLNGEAEAEQKVQTMNIGNN